MNEQKSQGVPPFKTLGTHLKYLREQGNESLQEASGAVEIDTEALQRIEEGRERPSEDILLLLIQHYKTQDHEALQLWELAGYNGDDSPHRLRLDDIINQAGQKQLIMLMAMDQRTMYSDGLDVGINQAGITLNFTQSTGNNRRASAGRIGMSYEQAAQAVRIMQEALLKADYLRQPKGLPEPKDTDTDTQEHN
jgi:transcriptional regulator with XRE-family HTH domain